MTAVDQTSGEVDKIGPLEILRKYHAPGGLTKEKFGRHMLPLQAGENQNWRYSNCFR